MFCRKIILSGFLALGLLCALFAPARVTRAFDNRAKAAPVISLPAAPVGDKEELADLMVKVVAISAKVFELGYTVAHIEIDRIQKGEIYAANRVLYGSNNYRIIGAGGKGIADLDMKLTDESGTTIAKDTEADNVPIVEVNPKTQATYTIKVAPAALEKGFDEESSYYFCIIVAFKNK
jgi:hypothetical protein